jgi:hypothetical protein
MEAMSVTAPDRMKGWVIVNWPPDSFDAARPGQVVNSGSTATVTPVVCRVAPAFGVNRKMA